VSSVPGKKRPCEIELLDEEERGVLRLICFALPNEAGVEVAVANGSELGDCAVPHEGQNLAPELISVPHEEQ